MAISRKFKKLWRSTAFAAALAAFVGAGSTKAGQVVLDGSFGQPGARLGPNFVIPQSVGRLQGTTLFHSFSQFNIAAGESATFTANSSTTIANVIARVTGPSASQIDGLIRVDITNANFFLINPNGIVFGPMAQLDVQGSFAASTASYVRLADGARFSAVAPNDALLTSAPPAAFGFLGKGAGSITFTGPPGGSSIQQGGVLSVLPGNSISLIGGPVQVTGAQLQALSGQVNVVSVAGTGEVAVPTQGQNPAISPQTPLGPVQLTAGTFLSSADGGRVVVRCGSLNVNASSIIADTDVVPGGGIDLLATGAMSLDNAGVSAQTSSSAPAGSIRISAATLAMIGLGPDGSAPVSVTTTSTGAGGDVVLNVGSLHIAKDASVQAFSDPPMDFPNVPTGPGGNITVNATGTVVIDGTGAVNQTGLAAETRGVNSGPGGNVTVNAQHVDLISEGEITSLTKGSGSAGKISIDARTLFIDGHNSPMLTGLQGRVGDGPEDAGASGNGGAITVQAQDVRLVDNGEITASTFGGGHGGTIDLTSKTLSILGSPDAPFTGLFAQSIPVADLATTPGGGGEIRVKTGTLQITSRPTKASPKADRVPNPLTGISSQSQSNSAAGGISVNAGNVLVGRGGKITVQAPSVLGGTAGSLMVTSKNNIVLEKSTISAQGETGGDIRLTAGRGIYLFHGQVTAQAVGNGLSILIDPPAVLLNGGSTINGVSGGKPVVVQIHGALLESLDSHIRTDSNEFFPQVDLTGAILPLRAGAFDTGAGLAPTCATRLGGDVSSFVITGQGGIAPAPDEWQPDWILRHD